MKRRWTRISATTAVLTLAAALLTVAAAPAAQATYPLRCRGGDGMQMKFDLSARTITVRFRPGPGPAGNGLSPGQCSWLDRALRPGEPWSICHRNVSQLNFFWSTVGYTVQSNEAYWYLDYILFPSAYLTFNVYNEGSCMRLV